MGPSNPKVVVIGWQGANWKSIHPLVDSGQMPNLGALLERGVAGNVRAACPGDPALLWTSLATGTTADQHGILSALDCDPLSGRVRLAQGAKRRVKAVWNIAMQSGLVAHVAGWYAATPAEELNGSSISNEYVVSIAPENVPWPNRTGAIFPLELGGQVAGLRMHPAELSDDELLPFIPALAGIDLTQDPRPLALAEILAREISMHSIATWLLEHRPWNLMMTGWHALARACHRFMQYEAPQMSHVSAEDSATYGGVVAAMYRFHDMLLGRLIELAGPGASIVIVSPAGYRTGAERPISPTLQRLPGAWYRPHGILCMAGENCVRDELVHGATTFDLAPTILSMLGLPAGADMPGRVIVEALHDRSETERVPSWEAIPGACGMLPAESEKEVEAADAEIRELLGEGYSEPERPNGAAALINRERLLNTALIHLAAGRYTEARPVLAELAEGSPKDIRLHLWLAHCHLVCGDRDACRAVVKEIARTGAAGALASLIEAQLECLEGNAIQALAAAGAAESLGGDLPIVNYAGALIFLQLGRWNDAEKKLRRAVALDPTFQGAHDMLSRVQSARGDNLQAVETALSGLEIDYASAFSHFALGLAWAGAQDDGEALHAFEKSLAFDPESQQARTWVETLRGRVKQTNE